MKFTLPFLFVFSSSLLSLSTAFSQDLKPLDYKALFQKNKVASRTWYEIKYTGNTATDSLLKGKEVYDQQGRLIKLFEYFAGGKLLAEHTFTYDEKGKISKCVLQHSFHEMKPLEMILKYDEKGRLIERSLPEAVRNYWHKETLFYHTNGIITKTQQWYEQNGKLAPLTSKDYPASLVPKDNSLTLLYDQKSLPLVQNFYSSSGKMERAWRYYYTYH